MSCGGGHLGIPIGIKNISLVKDIPMIIHLQFVFSQFISFREEDLWNFSQSEHIIGPGSHFEYPTGTKNSNFVEDHLRNIPAKIGSNWPCSFGEEAWNVKSLQTTDDERQVMGIVHLDQPGDLITRYDYNLTIMKSPKPAIDTIYPHIKCWWYRTMLNFYPPFLCRVLAAILKMADILKNAELLL
jgi:hypothetical protein